jgi:hypothetical protein
MKLHRLAQTDYATFGRLEGKDSTPLGMTLELPWQENAHATSCIPAGTYECKRYLSPKRGYELFEVTGVPNRSNIEIHIGNTPHDTEGCILVGTDFGKLEGREAVLHSKPAFQRFMDYLKGRDTFTLEIEDPPHA